MASFNGAASCTPGTGGTPGRLIILLTELLAELDFELKCMLPEIFLASLVSKNLLKNNDSRDSLYPVLFEIS